MTTSAPIKRMFKTVPVEQVRHYLENTQTYIWDNRTSPSQYNARGVVFAYTASAGSKPTPGTLQNNNAVYPGSMVSHIHYDIQMGFTHHDDGTVGYKNLPSRGSALYVWPLTLSDAEAQQLADYATTFFEINSGDFNIKNVSQATWESVMAEMLLPEVVKIVGKPIQFMPTTVSDAEKLHLVKVPPKLKVWKEKQWIGWFVFFDSKFPQQNTGTTSYDDLQLTTKVLFNEFVP